MESFTLFTTKKATFITKTTEVKMKLIKIIPITYLSQEHNN